jgi:hypothetical protein
MNLKSSVAFPRKKVTVVKILNAELSTTSCLCEDLFQLHRYFTLPRISFQRLRTLIGLELPEIERERNECFVLRSSLLSMVGEWNMITRSNGGITLTRKQPFSRNLSQCYFIHNKSHVDWPGSNPCFRGQRPGTSRSSRDTVLDSWDPRCQRTHK